MKLILTAILLTTLGIGSICAQDTYFPPANEWEVKKPTDFNIDETKLNLAVEFAQENEYTESRDLRLAIIEGFKKEPFHKIAGPTKKRGGPAGIILKDGYIVAQWGAPQTVDMTFSVTKSFLSTTALLALEEGLIANATEPVKNYVWDNTYQGKHNSQITWKHLLQQTSDWSGELWGGLDWADRPPNEGDLDDWKNRKLHTPGTVFEYNDVRVNLLAYSLLQVWRKPLPQVLKDKIMDPIGSSTTWRWFGYDNAWVDLDGLKMQSVTGGGHSGGGMFINTLDMARFGLLFENNGMWKGKQLLAEEFIKDAVESSAPNPNYGYMWWLNKPGNRHWKGLSENIFYAAGFGGNFIVIDQEKNLVIVTRWLEPSQIETFINKVYNAL
ncbi:serine hydrolase domain-containing protein [Gillisia marina]|uniref:serine hydrolase domain-containing protein n=1 Tax=Gillisia marina TaxID=1167637 RepID=UPI00029A8658|nr:serine hydrolase [Gillisia marina]